MLLIICVNQKRSKEADVVNLRIEGVYPNSGPGQKNERMSEPLNGDEVSS